MIKEIIPLGHHWDSTSCPVDTIGSLGQHQLPLFLDAYLLHNYTVITFYFVHKIFHVKIFSVE